MTAGSGRSDLAEGVIRDSRFGRRLLTPEGLDLRLEIATAGDRAAAFFLDLMFQLVILIAFSLAAMLLGLSVDGGGRELVTVIWILGWFFLRNGWFMLFELSPAAATPGKRLTGLRVIARDGGRLTGEAVLTRNAMREMETFLPLELLAAGALMTQDTLDLTLAALGLTWALAFLCLPLFNVDRMRAGDIVAGTWVVRMPKAALLPDLSLSKSESDPQFEFTPQQAGAYGVKELDVLEQVLRRGDAKSMALVAKRIRARIDYDYVPAVDDSAFLRAYYAALRAHLEKRLLFGHRRRDKHDRA